MTQARTHALDGLRTLAVGLVVAFHLGVPGLSPGYLGVDLFFVLSGFLITRNLLREADDGHVRLASFWARRLRRLLPAALLVIAVVTVVGWRTAPAYQQETLAVDGLAATWWWANWRFAEAGSYFAADGAARGLQHYWSLSLEEQFYLGWPLVLAALTTLLPRRRRVPAVAVVCSLAGVASVVALALLWTAEDPNRAYMGTDTKVFEPLLGALLACLWTRADVREAVSRRTGLMALTGGVVMAAAWTVSGDATAGYFRGGALAWSVGVVLVVAALAGGTGIAARALAWAPVAYLGRISYGIYLWHWPVALWLQPDGYEPGRALAAAGVTVVLAAASFHLLEEPVRAGRLGRWLGVSRTFPVMATASLLVTCLAVVGLTRPAPAPAAATPGETPTGPAPITSVVVVGDSVPQRIMPALATAGQRRGVTVWRATQGGCSPLAFHQATGSTDHNGAGCAAVADVQARAVAEHSPQLVVWWSRYEVIDRVEDGKTISPDEPRYWDLQRASLDATLDRLTSGGATVVIVETDRPGIGMRSRCQPGDCHPFLDRLLHADAHREHWNRIVRERAAQDPRVRVIGIDDTYCRTQQTPCDDTVSGTTLARPDGAHFAGTKVQADVATVLLNRALAAARR